MGRLLGLKAWGFIMVGFLLAAEPASAQSDLQEQIKALKEQLSRLEDQQLELTKEATAAAARLPEFSYRPGNGILIEAADKSWSLRTRYASAIQNGVFVWKGPSRPDKR